MFGSKKIQELESQLSSLTDQLNQALREKVDLTDQLDVANQKIAEMEAKLNDFDLEKLKEEARASRAEYEGLKALYAQKTKEFDDSKEEEEEKFAREAAIKRHDLDNEITTNRQANRDYVTQTVKTFGESYTHYLNQIKMLMDALGNVASRTGEVLFMNDNEDLKERFGTEMRETLKAGSVELLENVTEETDEEAQP